MTIEEKKEVIMNEAELKKMCYRIIAKEKTKDLEEKYKKIYANKIYKFITGDKT